MSRTSRIVSTCGGAALLSALLLLRGGAQEPKAGPAPAPGVIEREIRENARDILDQLRVGADEFLQEQ